MHTFDWVEEIKTVHVTPGNVESDEHINSFLKRGWRLVRHFERSGPGMSGGHVTDHYVLLARNPELNNTTLSTSPTYSKKVQTTYPAKQIFVSK